MQKSQQTDCAETVRNLISLFSILLISFSSVSPLVGQEDSPETEASSVVKTDVSETPVDSSFLYSGKEPTTIEQLRFMEKHVADLVKRVGPATVNIQAGAAQGTGVVISSDGYVLTAAHVIADAGKEATITFVDDDGKVTREVKAIPLGRETAIDSGMLKIKDDEDSDFPYLDIGISSDLNLGQWVMAIGHPGGIDTKRGLVTRIGRIVFKSERVIRTDCTLVGGDSGGPLVDMNGDVIGIHSRIGQRLTDNLHVPADTYSENWDDLANGILIDGTPNLGLSVEGDSNQVSNTVESGPAAKAGIKKDDLIIKIGSVAIASKSDIGRAIRELNLRPNQKTKVTVMRDKEEVVIELKVGEKKTRSFLGR